MKQINYDGYRSPPEIIQQPICSQSAIALLSVGNSRDTIRQSGRRRQQLVPMDGTRSAPLAHPHWQRRGDIAHLHRHLVALRATTDHCLR
jgi:hypothetical protein